MFGEYKQFREEKIQINCKAEIRNIKKILQKMMKNSVQTI